ncbi:MAG: carbohydrate deacetylase [Blastocatellales bacterium]
MKSSKKLIINADDYGACARVNQAVEQLLLAGRLRSVSVMANGSNWASAVDFLRDHPTPSVGVHLNAVEGQPISNAPQARRLIDNQGSFVGLRRLLTRWSLDPAGVYRAVELEWRAQIERLQRAGVRLTHADSHRHLHAFPLAYPIAVKLCHEYGIAALRWPCECGTWKVRRTGTVGLNASLFITKSLIRRTGLRHNNYFLGFTRAGGYGIEELMKDLRTIPAGVTEIALHPSMTDGYPYPNLHGNRERLALLRDDLPAWIKQLGIELTTWEDITT